MIFLEPENPAMLLNPHNFPVLEALIRAWQGHGSCERVEENTESKILSGSSIGSEFLADFRKSFEWRSNHRPQSIFYFHVKAAKIIELGLDGFFRMSMPHDVLKLNSRQMSLFIIRDDIISNSDIFDEYIFFRSDEPQVR